MQRCTPSARALLDAPFVRLPLCSCLGLDLVQPQLLRKGVRLGNGGCQLSRLRLCLLLQPLQLRLLCGNGLACRRRAGVGLRRLLC